MPVAALRALRSSSVRLTVPYRGIGRRAWGGHASRPQRQPVRVRRAPLCDQLAADRSAPSSHVAPDSLTVPSSTATTHDGYLQPSAFSRTLLAHAASKAQHHAVDSGTTHVHRPSGSLPTASSSSVSVVSSAEELTDQQRVLREAFAHASQKHRVRLRKDKRLYESECVAFRAAHRGRQPTSSEVCPYADVPLAPVAALKALAHLQPQTPTYIAVREALLLHQAVTRNKLLQSSEKSLMRCLRCFHFYSARPREIFGKQKGSNATTQSWIAYEVEKDKVDTAKQIAQRPFRRKTQYSTWRRREEALDNPMCCPQCGSPKAQWAVEYIHQRTHAK